MNNPYGPVNVEGMGIIIVPGNNDQERLVYANNLIDNFGVFIPTQGCSQVRTHNLSVPGNPIIALGTLTDYTCFDALYLNELVLFDPIFPLLKGHKHELLEFNSYMLPFFDLMYGRHIPGAWIYRVGFIQEWLDMEDILLNLPSGQLQQIIKLLEVIGYRANYICTNNPNMMNDDPAYRNAYNSLMALVPNLIIASPEYVLFSRAYQGIPDWCELYNDVNLLLLRINFMLGG